MDILGIDIGGTTIKGALVDPVKGQLVSERLRLTTPQPATPEAIADRVAQISRHFKYTGPIGCGMPAVIRKGVACTATNIDQAWLGTDVVALLSARTGLAVTVLNDADAAGQAEMHYGAGVGASGTTIMITAGTGLGTALFHDRTLLPNTELGQIQLQGKSAERVASAAVRSLENLSYSAWAQGFDSYLHLLEELLYPELFIVGGEISKEHARFFPHLTIQTRILPARFCNDAGIIGAAAAVLQQACH